MNRRTIEQLNLEFRSYGQLLRRSLFVVLMFYCSTLYSQTAKIDSLQTLLQTEIHDTTRINTLNALAWKLRIQKPDKCLHLSNEALNLAVKSRYGKGMAASYRSLGVVNKRAGEHNKALWFFRKEEKIRIELCEKMLDSDIPSQAVAEQAANCKQSLASTYIHIGLTYWAQDNYPKALLWSLKALRIYEEFNHSPVAKISRSSKAGIAALTINIGNIYYSQGDYKLAKDHYLTSLKLQEELHHKKGMATACSNIGAVNEDLGNYSEAMKWYIKGLKINKELGYKLRLAQNFVNVGSLYSSMADSAFSVEIKDSLLIQAMKFLQKSLVIVKEAGHLKGLTHTQIVIAGVLGKMSLYTEAIIWYNKVIITADSLSLKERLMVAYKGLAEVYFRLSEEGAKISRLARDGNVKQYYQEAFESYKLYTQAKDSLFNEDKSKEIGKLEARYEMEKKIEEEKRIAKEQESTLAKAQRRRDNLQYSGILIFLVLLGASLFAVSVRPLEAVRPIYLRLAEGLIFFTFLLFFEFTLVLLDPYIEQYSSGAPAITLAFNAVLAAAIFPLHNFFENKFKSRIVNPK